MRKITKLLVLSIMALTFVGCGQQVQPPLYSWGNYVNTSTEYGMNGHKKEVLEKHVQELSKIISESESKDKRVAPGIYAEYAQILFETAKKEEAKKYFLLEKNTYPESTVFIDRVMIKLYGATL